MAATSRWKGRGNDSNAPQPDGFTTPTGFGVAANPPAAPLSPRCPAAQPARRTRQASATPVITTPRSDHEKTRNSRHNVIGEIAPDPRQIAAPESFIGPCVRPQRSRLMANPSGLYGPKVHRPGLRLSRFMSSDSLDLLAFKRSPWRGGRAVECGGLENRYISF